MTSPVVDAIEEGRRIVRAAQQEGIIIRALGGVAVCMQSPSGRPLLPRALKDIDLVTSRTDGPAAGDLVVRLGYVGEEKFNALHGTRRQLYRDLHNARDLDIFVGEFSMCHPVPVADRLDREAYTIPLAELLLTKLQIVELNERDERDIFSLCYHHDVVRGNGEGGDIEADVIARLCANDWGLWRTCKATIDRCLDDLARYDLAVREREVITSRLARMRDWIDATPKTRKWKVRSRLGERKRWYQQPEDH